MMLSSAAVLTPSRIDDGAQQWQPQYIPPGLDLRIFPPVKPSFIGPVEPRHPMPCLWSMRHSCRRSLPPRVSLSVIRHAMKESHGGGSSQQL